MNLSNVLSHLTKQNIPYELFTNSKVFLSFPVITFNKHYSQNSNEKKSKTEPGKTNCSEKGSQSTIKLSVPPLKATIERWKETTCNFLTKEEYEETISELRKFLKGPALELQKLLEEEAKKHDNWLTDRWVKYSYLQYREPVMIYSNPALIYPPKTFKNKEEFIEYTSRLVFSALKFRDCIDKDKLEVEMLGPFPLDMSQYKKVFGTCRIPCDEEDVIKYSPKSQHIAVAYRNNWFVVQCYDKCGNLLHPDIIHKKLLRIYETSYAKDCLPIGLLTATDRDFWADAYNEFVSENNDKNVIEKIQTSLFTVSLDDNVKFSEKDALNVSSEQIIHGGSSKLNTGNRWFDKTIQFIVNPSGLSGICFEHSPAEIVPIAKMSDFILRSLDNPKNFKSGSVKDPQPELEKLTICLGPKTAQNIQRAKGFVDGLISKFDVCVLEYHKYGRKFIKSANFSPDCFCQIALQLAFQNLHKEPAPQSETAHLRLFKNGRTESIRSYTTAVHNFVQSMSEDSSCKNEERMELLQKAIESHERFTKFALLGRGVDRHLLGLKLMAIENNMDVPEFFNSPGFLKGSHFRLTTSQVPMNYRSHMVYGSRLYDGYGCCYNPKENSLILATSAWKMGSDTNSTKFCCSMMRSLDCLYNLVKSNTKKEDS